MRQADASTLGGSWVVISRVISRVAIVISYIRGLITPLITTHEPPSSLYSSRLNRMGPRSQPPRSTNPNSICLGLKHGPYIGTLWPNHILCGCMALGELHNHHSLHFKALSEVIALAP